MGMTNVVQVVRGWWRNPLLVEVHDFFDQAADIDWWVPMDELPVVLNLEELSLQVDKIDLDYLAMRLCAAER